MKNCLHCGSILEGNSRKKFCNRGCKNQSSNTRLQNYASQQTRGITRKEQAIEECGGKCNECGYSKNLAALTFHHMRDKKFTLDMRHFSNNSMNTLKEERQKCILLCMNCHMELHHPNLLRSISASSGNRAHII